MDEEKKKKFLKAFKELGDSLDDLITPSIKNDTALSRIEKHRVNLATNNPVTMLQLAMPRTDPGNVIECKIRNGESNLKIRSGIITNKEGLDESAGLPYDWFPRYILLWLSYNVMVTGNREIFMGHSEAQILENLNFERQSYLYKDLHKQIPALLNSELIISYEYPEINIGNEKSNPFQGKGDHREYRRFATSIDRMGSRVGNDSAFRILFSEDFYNSIMTNPLLVDIKHVKKLVKGGNCLKVDIYSFLVEKLYKISVDKPLLIRRHEIEDLFGYNNTDKGKFYRDKFSKALESVLEVYDTAKVEFSTKDGITLHHSPPPYPLEKIGAIDKLPDPSWMMPVEDK